jgi:hypothetical protein
MPGKSPDARELVAVTPLLKIEGCNLCDFYAAVLRIGLITGDSGPAGAVARQDDPAVSQLLSLINPSGDISRVLAGLCFPGRSIVVPNQTTGTACPSEEANGRRRQ